MKSKKIMVIFGTRAEAIKVAPVIKALKADFRFELVTVSTGQHREMLAPLDRILSLQPDIDLNLMSPGASLNEIISKIILELDAILLEEQPDVILVQGDTATTYSSALCAFHHAIPIVHLEAGLRTQSIHSPFPEEAYRRMISQIASLHLAPTHSAKQNLISNSINPDNIIVVGNTVIDSLLEASQWQVSFADDRYKALEVKQSQIVLVTTHRRENSKAWIQIGDAILELAQLFPKVTFVLPLHLNPSIRAALPKELDTFNNVLISSPLPYDEFVKLLGMSHLVLTDSGGIQEEAPALGKPVLCMRESTERTEAVVAGTTKLIGTSKQAIVSNVSKLLTDPTLYDSMSNAINPFGDGHASIRTIEAISNLVGFSHP